MTQLAARNPLEIYVFAALGGLDRAVEGVVLDEPRIRDEALATRAIACATETLAGLAIGAAIAPVAEAMRRTFGLAPKISTRVPPPARPPHWLERARAFTAAAELRDGLRTRIALGHRDVIAMLAPFDVQIVAAERSGYERTLAALAKDELAVERYTPHLQAGWLCVAAAIEGRTIPATDPLWQRWAQRFRRERPVITPSSEQLASAGVIMQIG